MTSHAELHPGVIDQAARDAFRHGACGGLAIVLHQSTGWPLVLVTDASSAYPDGESYEPLSDAPAQQRADVSNNAGMGASGLHWLVLHPSGQLLDIDGLHSPQDVLESYEGSGDEDCDGRVALAQAPLQDALEEYVDAKGEPVPLALAQTMVEPLLAALTLTER